MIKRFNIEYIRDLLIVSLFGPVLIFFFLVTAVFVVIFIGRPLFFRQIRIGLNGESFRILKFRSMSNAVDGEGELLSDEKRLGWAGKFIRRLRLDELPSFIHVYSGRISLVGPRPLPLENIIGHPLGGRRMMGKPGFTGLAQISGNTVLNSDEKFAIDVYYLEHRTVWMDLRIMIGTLVTVIFGERRNQSIVDTALVAAATGQAKEPGQ